MKRFGMVFCLLLVIALLFSGAQDAAAQKLLKGNVRIVIGSTSTGGDTYQASSIIAAELEKKLGVNIKVDAVGVTAAFDAIDRSSDGHTIMIFHDQSYLGYLYEIEGYVNIFEQYTVGPTICINPGNAYLVPKNSPYNTLDDVIAACGNGADIRVAIQPGGVSEIGFSAIKNAIRIAYPGMENHLVPMNTGSQANKDQLLFDGQADMINGSVQANEQYTRLPADDQKAMRFVWLTAANSTIAQANEEGFGETTREMLLEFVEPKISVTQDGTTNFTFDKDFFFIYNKEMSPELVAYYDKALTEIFAEGAVQEIQKKAFFIPNFKPAAEAQKYLEKKMTDYKAIIDAIK